MTELKDVDVKRKMELTKSSGRLLDIQDEDTQWDMIVGRRYTVRRAFEWRWFLEILLLALLPLLISIRWKERLERARKGHKWTREKMAFILPVIGGLSWCLLMVNIIVMLSTNISNVVGTEVWTCALVYLLSIFMLALCDCRASYKKKESFLEQFPVFIRDTSFVPVEILDGPDRPPKRADRIMLKNEMDTRNSPGGVEKIDALQLYNAEFKRLKYEEHPSPFRWMAFGVGIGVVESLFPMWAASIYQSRPMFGSGGVQSYVITITWLLHWCMASGFWFYALNKLARIHARYTLYERLHLLLYRRGDQRGKGTPFIPLHFLANVLAFSKIRVLLVVRANNALKRGEAIVSTLAVVWIGLAAVLVRTEISWSPRYTVPLFFLVELIIYLLVSLSTMARVNKVLMSSSNYLEVQRFKMLDRSSRCVGEQAKEYDDFVLGANEAYMTENAGYCGKEIVETDAYVKELHVRWLREMMGDVIAIIQSGDGVGNLFGADVNWAMTNGVLGALVGIVTMYLEFIVL